MKNNVSVGTRVVLKNLGGDELLEGATGTIAGKSASYPEIDFYIVILDYPLYARGGEKAITMIGSCIEPISYENTLEGNIQKQIDLLTVEYRQAKDFLNRNNFDCTTAPFVLVKKYRDDLKQHIRLLVDNLAD